MPMDRKSAYMQALARSPDLVSTETDSLQFVRYSNYSVPDGAERLVLYWEERRKLFGDERAFLPLTLTGMGALTSDDAWSLKAGYPALLPTSTSGLQVMLCDQRQVLQNSSTDVQVRGAFYLIHLLSKDDIAQAEGVLLLVALTMPRLQSYDTNFQRIFFSLTKLVFPVRFRIHVLNRLPRTANKRQDVHDRIVSYSTELMNLGYDASDFVIHIEQEDGKLLEALTKLGLTREGIPTELGGSWTFQDFSNWCRDRASFERQQHRERRRQSEAAAMGPPTISAAAPAVGTQAPAFLALSQNPYTLPLSLSSAVVSGANAAMATPATIHPPAPSPQSASSSIQEEERRDRVRLSNAIHSRRKRDRRRQEFADLKRESEQVHEKHRNLVAENIRLNELLRQAQQSVVEAVQNTDTNLNDDEDQKAQRSVDAGDNTDTNHNDDEDRKPSAIV